MPTKRSFGVPRKKDAKNQFNYKTMKALNFDKQMKSVWDIKICIGNERLKDEAGNKVHSTQKPEALLYNVILSSTVKGDIILDPFFGTGTTGAVAKRLGRRYIGIERNETYIAAAQKRIDAIKEESDDYINGVMEVKPPRVSITELIEKGFLSVGQTLYSSDKMYEVRLLSCGKVKYNNTEGSIHKISALIKKTPNSNGWDYFYCIHNGRFVPINELRYLANGQVSERKTLAKSYILHRVQAGRQVGGVGYYQQTLGDVCHHR